MLILSLIIEQVPLLLQETFARWTHFSIFRKGYHFLGFYSERIKSQHFFDLILYEENQTFLDLILQEENQRFPFNLFRKEKNPQFLLINFVMKKINITFNVLFQNNLIPKKKIMRLSDLIHVEESHLLMIYFLVVPSC